MGDRPRSLPSAFGAASATRAGLRSASVSAAYCNAGPGDIIRPADHRFSRRNSRLTLLALQSLTRARCPYNVHVHLCPWRLTMARAVERIVVQATTQEKKAIA